MQVETKLRGVLFDLDNTLVHRSRSIARYAERFSADFAERLELVLPALTARLIDAEDNGGYLPPGSRFPTIGDAVAQSLAVNLRWNSAVETEELVQHWRTFFPACAVEMDGAEALVDALVSQGLVVGIVSNGAERSRRETVARLSFRRHVTTVLSSERAGVKKPDSRIFTQAATELGLANTQSVFVGDHPLNDVKGALESGMSAIWLRGFHCWPNNLAATVPVASSLLEVGNHIARMHRVR